MLNRRLIRIKVFQAFYAYLQDESPSLNKSKSYLEHSISGIENNFFTVLTFPLELAHYISVHLNPEDNKYVVKDEDVRIYNNLCFNGIYDTLVHHDEIQQYMAKPNHRWQDNPEVLRNVYNEVKKSEVFAEYLAINNPTVEEQTKAFLDLFKYVIESNEEFYQEMEEINMLWEDEQIPVRNATQQYIKAVLNGKKQKAVGKKDDSDWEFAEELMEKSVRNYSDYVELIATAAPKWDKERIARTDMVLMTMALTELMHFPYIPVKVTLNEYLELAKNYSTPQSSKFVNGVLDKLVKQLKAEDKIVKKGRGMVG